MFFAAPTVVRDQNGCTPWSSLRPIAILKKRLELPDDLYTIPRVLDLTPFMHVPLHQLLAEQGPALEEVPDTRQMGLFET